MSLFDVREMIEMAVRDEEAGEAFYAALAETVTPPALAGRFRAIAAQEKGHAARYRGLLAEHGSYVPVQESYTGEYEAYLGALLSDRALPTPAAAAAEARRLGYGPAALDAALKMETDSVRFYVEIRKFVDTRLTGIVNDIIQEEKDHVDELTRLKQAFAK